MDEFRLMPIYVIFQCEAHHVPKSAGGKSIIRVFIDPLKKRLAEYLEFFKPKILALPEKPLDLIGRQSLGNDRINLISIPVSERVYWVAGGHKSIFPAYFRAFP